MGTPLAIVIAAVIIAGAILVEFRWEITPYVAGPTALGSGGFYQLDRWTGHVSLCSAAGCP